MESQQSRAAGRTQIGGWLRGAASRGRVTYRGEGEWAAYFGEVVFTLKVTEQVLIDEEVVDRAIERLEREGYPDLGGSVKVTEAWARGIDVAQ